MVANYLSGGAAINVARQHGLALIIMNAGVAALLDPTPGLRIKSGMARNCPHEPAMSEAQCMLHRADAVRATAIADGSNALLLGEMGIGNTTSAALMLHRLTAWPVAECVGRGTGLDDSGLAHKRHVVERASARVDEISSSPLQALTTGGSGCDAPSARFSNARSTPPAVTDASPTARGAGNQTRFTRSGALRSAIARPTCHRAVLRHLGVEPYSTPPAARRSNRCSTGMAAAGSERASMSDMASFESAGVDDRSNKLRCHDRRLRQKRGCLTAVQYFTRVGATGLAIARATCTLNATSAWASVSARLALRPCASSPSSCSSLQREHSRHRMP
jgi:nicotinate-nucleotide--dimethylbenzimidazole phosphoribosyltransferase